MNNNYNKEEIFEINHQTPEKENTFYNNQSHTKLESEFNLTTNQKEKDDNFEILGRNTITVNLQKELQSVKIDNDQTVRKAIPLIMFNTNNQESFFELTEEAETFLKTIKDPVSIVSVAGMYRTGKSYLLNKAILSNKGDFKKDVFQVGPTISACTKGIWIYPETIPISDSSNPDKIISQMLVIDTEGIGATDEDCNHDTKIFALALLLSSYFIYNSIGSIDENALNNLSFVSNLTKHIQITRDTKPFLPSFLWVLRDFSLRLQDENGFQISPKEYLEKALKINTNLMSNSKSNIKTGNKNAIREHLRNYFPNRDCVALIRPTLEESDLQNLSEDNLRPEFIEQINSLRTKIMKDIKPKELKGHVLNGEMFVSLIKSYINAINLGEIPDIDTAYCDISKLELKNMTNKAINKFNSEIESFFSLEAKTLPCDQTFLLKKIEEIKKSARELIYKKNTNSINSLTHMTSSISVLDDCLSKFKNEISKKIDILMNENIKLSEQVMKQYLEDNFCFDKEVGNTGNIGNFNYNSTNNYFNTNKYSKIAVNHSKNNSSIHFFEEFKKSLRSRCFSSDNFDSSQLDFKLESTINLSIEFVNYLEYFLDQVLLNGPKGPKCNQVLIQFLIGKNKDFFVNYTSNITSEIEQLNDKVNKLQLSYKEDLDKISKSNQQEETTYQQSIKNLKLELVNSQRLAEISQNSYEDKINHLEKDNSRLEERVKQLSSQIMEINESADDDKKKKIENLENEILKINEKMKEKEKENILLSQKITILTEENKGLLEKVKDSEISRYSNETIKNKKNNSVLVEKLEQQIKSINLKTEQLQEININLETKLLEKEKRLENEKSKFDDLNNETTKKIAELEEELQNREIEISSFKCRLEQIRELNETENKETLSKLSQDYQDRLNKLELEIKEKDDFINSNKKEIQKLNQSLDFLNYEMNGIKDKIKEKERNSMQQNREIDSISKENSNLQNLLKQERDINETRIKNLNNELESLVNSSKKESEENLIKINLLTNEYQMQVKSLNSQIEQLKTKVNLLTTQLNDSNNNLLKKDEEISILNEQHRESLDKNVNETHVKYEKLLKKAREEVTENNEVTKLKLNEIREFYEKEKKILEEKIEENQSNNIKELEELKNRHNEELNNKEEEYNDYIDELREEFDQENTSNKNYIEQLEKEISSLQSKIESLQTSNSELSKHLEDLKDMHLSSLSNLQSSANNEKTDIYIKLEEANKSLLILEKEKTLLESKNDYLNNALLIKENDLKEKEKDFKTHYSKLEEKIKLKKEEIKNLINQLTEIKQENSTLKALHKQEVDYKDEKIKELSFKIDISENDWIKKREEIREEIENEFKKTIDCLFNEKQELENKLHILKKENNKLETSFKSSKVSLEKELAVLNEKYINAMKMKEELLNTTETERERMNEELAKLKQSRKLNESELYEKLEQLKQTVSSKDGAISQLTSKVELATSNLQSKVQFYEGKSDELKAFYSNQIKEYELKICSLKQEFTEEKQRLENYFIEKQEKLENFYKDHLKEIKQEHFNYSEEQSLKMKEILSENKKLTERVEEIQSLQHSNAQHAENKIRKEYDTIIRELTKENLDKASFSQKNLKEKYEQYVDKVMTLEKKLLEYENKESQYIVDLEKTRNEHYREVQNLKTVVNSLKMKLVNAEKEKDEESSSKKEILLNRSKTKDRGFVPKIREQSPKFMLYNSENKENSSSNYVQTSKNAKTNFNSLYKLPTKNVTENKTRTSSVNYDSNA